MASNNRFPASVEELCTTLTSPKTPLPVRFRALFSLKHLAALATDSDAAAPALNAIAAAFTPEAEASALLKHELAYCLGQTGKSGAAPCLRQVLQDLSEDAMVRHESAEALGALGDPQDLELLRRFRDREGEDVSVRETCEIAIQRIEWEQNQKINERIQPSDFSSVDPAPAISEIEELTVDELSKELMDTSLPLFRRYRAMFSLRDMASSPDMPHATAAVEALTKGLNDKSALFRHEIAFVFGQILHPASIPALTATLSNLNEASMVRHEAAEALGSLGKEPGVEDTLKKFVNDNERVVRESVIVALDMAEYEKSDQIEYALIPKNKAQEV